MCVLKLQPALLGANGLRFEEKDTGDDLEAIGHTMAHFGEQQFLLASKVSFSSSKDFISCSDARLSVTS